MSDSPLMSERASGDLQSIIASATIKAYNQGLRTERERVIGLLKTLKEATACSCAGCESWTNAFDYLMTEVGEA
jgi:hypothetical protein